MCVIDNVSNMKFGIAMSLTMINSHSNNCFLFFVGFFFFFCPCAKSMWSLESSLSEVKFFEQNYLKLRLFIIVDLRTRIGKASKVDTDKILPCSSWLSTKGSPSKDVFLSIWNRATDMCFIYPTPHTQILETGLCSVGLRAQLLKLLLLCT